MSMLASVWECNRELYKQSPLWVTKVKLLSVYFRTLSIKYSQSDPGLNTSSFRRLRCVRSPPESGEPFWKFPSLAVVPLCCPAPAGGKEGGGGINKICRSTAKLPRHRWRRQTVGEQNWLSIKIFSEMMISKFVHIDEALKVREGRRQCDVRINSFAGIVEKAGAQSAAAFLTCQQWLWVISVWHRTLLS